MVLVMWDLKKIKLIGMENRLVIAEVGGGKLVKCVKVFKKIQTSIYKINKC